MKALKVGLMACLALAAGRLAAAAQSASFSDSLALDYTMNAQFLTSPPSVVAVTGLLTPTLTDLEPMLQGATYTDNSGKIEGVQYARVYFGGAGNQTSSYATFIINITGTIRGNGGVPTVKMTLKGNGYDTAAQADHPDASLNLKFTSTTGPVAVSPNQPVTVTNANYTVTYLNGSPVLLTTNVPTTYSGYSVNPTNYEVTFDFTNGPATYVNADPYSMISGMLTGTINPGKKSPWNGGKPLKVNETAQLFTDSVVWTVVDGTNFVQQTVGGSLGVNVLSNLTAQVVQPVPGKKLYLSAGVGSALDPFSGSGTVNYNQATFKAKLTGVSPARGGTLTISGTLGPVIIGYQPTTNPSFPTGYVTNRAPDVIQQISVSGKVMGQTVPVTSGVNPDAPFP